jgi:3-oxoacyl-[acyl-carrier protein] reductase
MRDQVVVVTGAASGIGHAAARGFATDGAKVVALDINPSVLDLNIGGIWPLVVDVTLEASVAGAISEIKNRHDRIDVWINNAAVLYEDWYVDRAFANWQRTITVNLIGTMLCCHQVLPEMISAGKGRIINVASFAAEAGVATQAAYSASKAGVVLLTRALAAELADQPAILINAISPGETDTGMHTGGQNPADVYPHLRFLAQLPDGAPSGKLFFLSKEFPIFSRYGDAGPWSYPPGIGTAGWKSPPPGYRGTDSTADRNSADDESE